MTQATVPYSTEDLAIEQICRMLHQWCGVTLDQSKHYLVRNRLRPVMHDFGLKSLSELVARSNNMELQLRDRIVDALTTHETLFFRDSSPFEALSNQILPEIKARTTSGKPRLRIWSAACSTGQEPYSIAIRLLESIPHIESWDVSILATDVSPLSVEQAKQGVYQEHELRRGLSPELQIRHFERLAAESWRVNQRVRRMVQFQSGNLLSASQPTGPFELIFCRNVAIYFDKQDRQKAFRMLANRIVPGGRLFVGCSEVLTDLKDCFATERLGSATCYRKI